MAEIKTMRDVFIERLIDKMGTEKELFFLSADFGSPKLDRLRQTFPDRFINVGIAEQNLINVSAGLALEGCTVFAYAIAPFLTMRAYEQIRNNLSLLSTVKNVNVNIIGVGAGLSYDVSGPTHHCLEDLTLMRVLPNLTVFSPSDWRLAEAFVDHSIAEKTPKYLRFDGKPLPAIYDRVDASVMKLGFCELKQGTTVCLVSTGFMTHRAIDVAAKLLKKKVKLGVVDVFRLKPLDLAELAKVLNKYQAVITIEEAFIDKGGLDSLVSLALEERRSGTTIKRIGFADKYVFEVGGREYLHRLAGLDEDSLIKIVEELL
jgi:transketolase